MTAPRQPADGVPLLKAATLDRLASHVTGDSKLTPNRSGPVLVKLFNSTGQFDDSYPAAVQGSSRGRYTDERLRALNDRQEILAIIEQTFDPVHFAGLSQQLSLENAVTDMNIFLQRDGLRVIIVDPRSETAN